MGNIQIVFDVFYTNPMWLGSKYIKQLIKQMVHQPLFHINLIARERKCTAMNGTRAGDSTRNFSFVKREGCFCLKENAIYITNISFIFSEIFAYEFSVV